MKCRSRRVVKSKWWNIEDLGHGYVLERTKKYNDGHIQPVKYFLWNKPEPIKGRTGYKYIWPHSDKLITLPKDFQAALRAFAQLKP